MSTKKSEKIWRNRMNLFVSLFDTALGVPILKRRHAEFFLEDVLKIPLAGVAEVAADFRQAFIAEQQEAFGFLQLAAADKSARRDAEFFSELLGDKGRAAVGGVRHILYADGAVHMAADIAHGGKDVGGEPLGNFVFPSSGCYTKL